MADDGGNPYSKVVNKVINLPFFETMSWKIVPWPSKQWRVVVVAYGACRLLSFLGGTHAETRGLPPRPRWPWQRHSRYRCLQSSLSVVQGSRQGGGRPPYLHPTSAKGGMYFVFLPPNKTMRGILTPSPCSVCVL